VKRAIAASRNPSSRRVVEQTADCHQGAVGGEACDRGLEEPVVQARVRIHDHHGVVVALGGEQLPQDLVQGACLLVRIAHRLDHLDAGAPRDFHRGVGAVVRDHDDALGWVRLAHEGRDGLRKRRLLVVRRDQDRDGHRAGEDTGGSCHHQLGRQRIGLGVDGATGAVGDP